MPARAIVVVAALAVLILLGYSIIHSRLSVPPNLTYKDSPGGDISVVQFDFETTSPRPNVKNGLRLYLCTQAKSYRLISEEIAPNPRLLIDETYQVTQECGYKYPVVNLEVGDVEEISIGTGGNSAITDVRVYRITRTEDGIRGEFVGLKHTEISTPFPVTPSPRATVPPATP